MLPLEPQAVRTSIKAERSRTEPGATLRRAGTTAHIRQASTDSEIALRRNLVGVGEPFDHCSAGLPTMKFVGFADNRGEP